MGEQKFVQMATIPIYGKNFKISYPGTKMLIVLRKSNLVPYAFIWEKDKTWIFQKLL